MEIILILIGGSLTFLGGYAQQRIQNIQSQKQNDKLILIQLLDILFETDRIPKFGPRRRNFTECMDDLYQLCLRFQREKNMNLAQEIRNFVKKNRDINITGTEEGKKARKEIGELILKIEEKI